MAPYRPRLLPKGMSLEGNSIRRIVDKHGSLQGNSAALDEIESVLCSQPGSRGGNGELMVTARELMSSEESLEVFIVARTGRRGVVVTLHDDGGRVIEEVYRVVRGDAAGYPTALLAPRGYTLAVRDVAIATLGNAITSSFLVWPARDG